MKTKIAFLFSCILCATFAITQPESKLLGDDYGDPVKLVQNSNLSSQTKSKFTKAYSAATEELFGSYNLVSERNKALKAFEAAVLDGKGKDLIKSSWLKALKEKHPGNTFEVRKTRFIELVQRMESETEDE